MASLTAAKVIESEDDMVVRACVSLLCDGKAPAATNHAPATTAAPSTGSSGNGNTDGRAAGAAASQAAPAAAAAGLLAPGAEHRALHGGLRVLLRICQRDTNLCLTAAEYGALVACMWLTTRNARPAEGPDSSAARVRTPAASVIDALLQAWMGQAGWVHAMCAVPAGASGVAAAGTAGAPMQVLAQWRSQFAAAGGLDLDSAGSGVPGSGDVGGA
mmetsp:Transcript_20775/g.52766  ORF Transcript_20775/g.52766 Transcript_20775/m.52766 type:complete len:216 (-) Transcript_20775:26-673(-)